MIKDLARYSIIVLLLLMLQLLVFSRLNLGYMFKPFPYVWFIFLLPFRTNRYGMLVLGFLTGFILDFFSNTYGLHAAATTLLAFGRVMTDRRLNIETAQREGHERPERGMLGLGSYLLYLTGLCFAHHTLLFYYEAFRVTLLPQVLFTALLSTIGTVASILLLEAVFVKRSIR
ncbi:MAG: rod shape-determining protein MreD [Bacteroidetes bacterium]|nr:rod shape-determining protein MreD [Bacteroidota bacterium]